MEINKKELLSDYLNNLIDINEQDIVLLDLGFIADNKCETMILPILLNCVENIEIFNETQTNNIIYLLNKYGNG